MRGKGACGKCRVIVRDQSNLGEMPKDEAMHLTPEDIDEGYRLACCCIAKGCDFVVFVPPESKVMTRQIQVEGMERPFKLNPAVEKCQILLIKPSIHDVKPDFERLSESLRGKGFVNLEIDHELLEARARFKKGEVGNRSVTEAPSQDSDSTLFFLPRSRTLSQVLFFRCLPRLRRRLFFPCL